MSIAQGYILCLGVSAFVGGAGLIMLFIGVTRRGSAADMDDSAAHMLALIGVLVLVVLILFWIYAWGIRPSNFRIFD